MSAFVLEGVGGAPKGGSVASEMWVLEAGVEACLKRLGILLDAANVLYSVDFFDEFQMRLMGLKSIQHHSLNRYNLQYRCTILNLIPGANTSN